MWGARQAKYLLAAICGCGVVAYLVAPLALLTVYEKRYVDAIRSCLVAKQSQVQASSIAALLPEYTIDRLQAAVNIELVSCDVQQRLGNQLIANRVPAAKLRAIEFGVLLEASTPIGSKSEDLDR